MACKITGTLTAKASIQGVLSSGAGLTAQLQLPDASNVHTFDGDYEYTPSEETQTIEIGRKIARGDITINPIPQNYGLITWNGHHLTVS